MILLFVLAASTVTATCKPPKTPYETRGETVDSFIDAMSRHDTAALGSYIKPRAKAVTGKDEFDLAELLSAMNPKVTLTVLDKKFNQDETIDIRYRTSDGDEVSVSFAQTGGCVTRMTQL